MILYFVKMAAGQFEGLDAKGIEAEFANLTARPGLMFVCMAIVVILCFAICSMGLQKGVEKITKVMMILLLALMIILAVRSATLPNAGEGIRFYLLPDFGKVKEAGVFEVVYAAMGQSFFTLSLGIGAIAIFGSYIDKKRALTGEAICVTILDTCVALIAGMIIFPACFAFGVNPGQGPSLIFITLPNIFNAMSGGRIWGTLFFLCMFFAAASTIIAVFENIIAITMEIWNIERKRAVKTNMVMLMLLSMPAVLGYNLLSGIQPMGAGTTIMDLEDFLVSYNILPLGGLVFVLFCTKKNGWGFENFRKEVNTGVGFALPGWIRGYMSYVLPLIMILVYLKGYYDMFSSREPAVFLFWMLVAVAFLLLVISFSLRAGKRAGQKKQA